ncbi:MAG: hypothetical protein M3P96_06730 [Actinomycetota bacterium]|nr:hypothetical protein [Actinomycetota bacterium]
MARSAPPDLPAPPIARLSRPRWLDARLLLGVLLVLGSVVAGSRILAAADDSVAVWAVTGDLGPGTTLAASDLVVRRVGLADQAGRYVSVDAGSPAGRVLVRAVGRDELLPAAALAAAGPVDLRRVTVETPRTAGLARGAVVDVYRVAEAQPGRIPEPAGLVLSGITVAEVEEPGRVVGARAARGVTLLLPAADVRILLDAQAVGRIELAQVPSGGRA